MSDLVVALRPLGLGDLLTAVPALRALQRAFGERRVVVAAPEALEPIAALAGVRLVGARPLEPLPPRLREAALLVNLDGRGPQSHRIAIAARPRRLLAFAHPEVRATRGMPAWRPDEHEVRRWCRLLTESGIPADPADLHLPVPDVPVDEDVRGATLIHPGAASPARRWPPERFAEVARREAEAGRAVVITGTAEETAIARDVAARAGLPDESVVAGRTSLLELAALVGAAARVVCGDTGVAHLATALRIPSVLLFGPTSPRDRGPLPGVPRHRVLWAGETGDPHADRPHDGLLRIDVPDVLDELAALR